MAETEEDVVTTTTDSWSRLSRTEREEAFRTLRRHQREQVFLNLSSQEQAELLVSMPAHEQFTYIRVLAPDDAADLIQEAPFEERDRLLTMLDPVARAEVGALLAYAEDEAGGLMSPRFARLRPDMTVDEAISYLRIQGRRMETVYYAYVLDPGQRLLGVVSFRDLFGSRSQSRVVDVMCRDVVSVPEKADQEEVARVFSEHALAAIPVVDKDGRMKGIVTIDDIVDVVQEEATEDIQKIGGMEALDSPYLETSVWRLVRKRAGWLSLLLVGEMLTATVMARYEHEIAAAIVLAVFVPLIISSGGNSGSQASTLIVRAMALREVRMFDWLRVARRELVSGLVLGGVLAIIGFLRIVMWEAIGGTYGEHYILIATTVAVSLLGVVLFGTITGSMLPFLLRMARLDPATASAPFVATLVDVTGLLIYFTVASYVLAGTLL